MRGFYYTFSSNHLPICTVTRLSQKTAAMASALGLSAYILAGPLAPLLGCHHLNCDLILGLYWLSTVSSSITILPKNSPATWPKPFKLFKVCTESSLSSVANLGTIILIFVKQEAFLILIFQSKLYKLSLVVDDYFC